MSLKPGERYFASFLLLLILFSCNQKEDNAAQVNRATSQAIEAQGTVMPQESLKPPQIVLLSTMPKPLTIEVPAKAGDSYIKKINNIDTKIDLLPPETLPAGFLHIMPNYTSADGLASDAITCGIIDKMGNLWFGTFGAGVSRYDGKSFFTYTKADGLANNGVWSLLEDKKGNLWFGTYGEGMSRYDGESIITFTTEEGLPDNVIYQIITTKEHDIALGTNYGIAVLKGYTSLSPPSANASRDKQGNGDKVTIPPQNHLKNEALKSYKPVFEIYNSKNGYPIKDANGGQNSMYLDSKGIIWMGTGSAKTSLVRLNFSALNKNNNPPDVFIQSIKIDNQNISWYDLINKKPETQSSKTEKNGMATPPNLTEEVITFGRPLSEAERDAMRSKFGDIKIVNQ